MPLRLLLPKIDDLYKTLCLHCHFGKLWEQQILLGLQTLAAVLFTIGYKTRIMAAISWYMYTSLILRNTWLYFILDRYFYYLLFYSMFLPLDEKWSVEKNMMGKASKSHPLVINPATVSHLGCAYDTRRYRSRLNSNIFCRYNDDTASVHVLQIGLKLLVFWIYLDAGGGKYLDPQHGWSYYADPLPALDTYTRHTIGAQYMYGLLGPQGLRVMTPLVVYVELLCAPLAFLASYLGNQSMLLFAIGMICQLHVGISIAIRNAVLLSYVACSAWCIFLPIGWNEAAAQATTQTSTKAGSQRSGLIISSIIVGTMICGNIWFETIGADCGSGSQQKVWSTLLQNRWNVFIGAEEYVTWYVYFVSVGKVVQNKSLFSPILIGRLHLGDLQMDPSSMFGDAEMLWTGLCLGQEHHAPRRRDLVDGDPSRIWPSSRAKMERRFGPICANSGITRMMS